MAKVLKKKVKSFDDLPVIMTVADIQSIMRVSIANAYKIMASENFPKMKVGKRVLVEKSAFIKWLSQISA